MTTILTQGNNDSTRRCDAKCHNAKESGCTCVCGGRYHGAGSSREAQELLQADIEAGRLGEGGPAVVG